MKKHILLTFGLMLLLFLVACGSTDETTSTNSGDSNGGTEEAEANTNEETEPSGGPKSFSIATAGTGGALYPMGVAMGQTISNHTDFSVNGQATGGSVENIRNLMQDRVAWAISQNEVAYFAFAGVEEYEGIEFKELRSLFGTVSGWIQIFVSADSDINSIEDFKGKRIGVGAPGSGGETAARRVLSYHGITFDDIRPEFISDGEMVEALRDGTIDGFISTHPLNSAPIRDLLSSTKVKMVGIEDEGFYEEYPYYTKAVINAYDGLDPVNSATSRVYMFTRSDTFTDDEIYELVSTIFENRDEWKDVHAAMKEISLDTATIDAVIPFHPGAIKYFEEKGYKIPAELQP